MPDLTELQRLADRAERVEALLTAIDRFITAQISLKLQTTNRADSLVWARKAADVEEARNQLRTALEELK